MKHFFILIAVLAIGLSTAFAQELPKDSLITRPSSFGMTETLQRLRAGIEGKSINLVAEVDHAKAAADKGLELRPTHLLIFGNPLVGTNLMQADQRAGLDLPLRLLVWQDEEGQVYLTYHPPRYLQYSYGLQEQSTILDKMDNVFEHLTQLVRH